MSDVFCLPVINVSVSSSVFNNILQSDSFGKYLFGKAVCRIPCTPGSPADGVWQVPGPGMTSDGQYQTHDQYQCDRNAYYAGTGNRFVSDTHIICIAPAGVGLSQGLTVAVGSTQVDGPSPVPNEVLETAAGQSHNRGLATIAAASAAGSPLHVDSVLALFGPGACDNAVGIQSCTSSKACGEGGSCSSQGALFIGASLPFVPPLSHLSAVAVISTNYDTNLLTLAPGSFDSAVTASEIVLRVPGINVMDSDSQLDQMQYAHSMFSYERPTVISAAPKLGAVMLTRQITVDGMNFGVQTRYVEVRVSGLPYKLHPFGDTLLQQEHVCCQCYWQCSGNDPRTCSCSADPQWVPINGTCVDLSQSGSCGTHLVELCKIYTVHEQLQTAVPNMYSQYNQGLLPINGLIPKQTLSPSTGDKQFQLCVNQDPWCPLSTIPDTYMGHFLTVSCPAMSKPETILITEYKGVFGTDPAQFYMVTLKDSLSVKPDCDDSLKVCCSYTLTFQDYFSGLPNFKFYDRYHSFPGFCGQHIIRTIIDGQMSLSRSMQKENMNRHSLLYYDDKPVSFCLVCFVC